MESLLSCLGLWAAIQLPHQSVVRGLTALRERNETNLPWASHV